MRDDGGGDDGNAGRNALRALLVSYNFPPVGGAGVQRMAKLAKYLPGAGVRAAVLTVSNPSVPVRDESLVGDLPASAELVRVPTLEPGYGAKQAAWSASASASAGASRPSGAKPLSRVVVQRAAAVARQLLVPDPQVLWQPAAQLALARRLAAGRDDAVLVSGPPFSQFLLGPIARRSVGLVLDYRDEWSTYRTTYEMGGTAGARLGAWLEPRILRLAHFVTTATDEFREALLTRFAFLDPARVVTIPNGYDEDDFAGLDLDAPLPSDKLVVTYAGTVFKLTSARGLLRALERLHERAPALAARLETRFLGRIVDTEMDAFAGAEALGVKRLGYVPHADVLPALAASHMCLCLLDDVPGVERIYPAKIFELLRLGRPVLTLAPEGALSRLVARHALGDVVPPRDEAAIAAALARALGAFVAGAYDPRAHAIDVAIYDRRETARAFAAVLRDAAALGRRRAAA